MLNEINRDEVMSEAKNIPLLVRRGGCASEKWREATEAAQTGWSKRVQTRIPKYFGKLTTPSAPSKVASQYLLDVASTPPHEEGNIALPHSRHSAIRAVIDRAYCRGRHLSTNSDTSMTANRAYSVNAPSCPRSVVFSSTPKAWLTLDIASSTNLASSEIALGRPIAFFRQSTSYETPESIRGD